MKKYYQELESLRGVAAIQVLLAHCISNFGPGGYNELSGFTLISIILLRILFSDNSAVILFFVMSGYVLGLQFKNITGSMFAKLKSFYIRRLFRLTPAMWVTALFAWAVNIAIHRINKEDYLLLIETLLYGSSKINAPLWSVDIEFYLSLFFPFLYLLVRFYGFGVNLFGLIIFVYLMADSSVPEFMRYVIFFQLGLLINPISHFIKQSFRNYSTIILYFSILIYMVIPPLIIVNGYSNLIWQVTSGAASLIIISIILTNRGNMFCRFLLMSPIRFIGKISYSLYLIHYIIIDIFTWLASKYHQDYYYNGVLYTITGTIFVALISVILANLLYKNVELPINKFGKKISS